MPKLLPQAGLPAVFAPDSKTLATAGPKFAVQLWDVDGDNPTVSLTGHDHAVGALVFSPDGRTLVSTTEDDLALMFKLWDIAGRSAHVSFTTRIQPYQKMGLSTPPFFTVDGKTVVWKFGGTVGRVEVETGKGVPQPREIQTNPVSAVSPDGRRMVVLRGVHPAVFDSATKRVRHLGDNSGYAQNSCWFTNDGKKVIQGLPQPLAEGKIPVGTSNARFQVFDAITGQKVAAYSLTIPRTPLLPGAVTGDGQIQVRHEHFYPYDPALTLADVATGRQLGILEINTARNRTRFTGRISPAGVTAFSPDGKVLASVESAGGETNVIRLWEVASGRVRETWRLRSTYPRIHRLVFRADGHMLFALTSDQVLYRCDLVTGKLDSDALPLSGYHAAIRNDGKLVAYAAANEIGIFDMEADTVHPLAKLANVTALEMTPDGKSLAVLVRSSDQKNFELRVFNLKNEKQLWRRTSFLSHFHPHSSSFRPMARLSRAILLTTESKFGT